MLGYALCFLIVGYMLHAVARAEHARVEEFHAQKQFEMEREIARIEREAREADEIKEVHARIFAEMRAGYADWRP